MPPPLFIRNHPTQPCCYFVESISNPGNPHTVDLLENNGAAVCTCADYIARRGPALRSGAQILSDQTTCKHIRAALSHFLRETLPAMSEQLSAEMANRRQTRTPTQPASSVNAAHSVRTGNGSLERSFPKPTLAARPAVTSQTTTCKSPLKARAVPA